MVKIMLTKGINIGGYVIDRLVDEGGWSTLYQVHHQTLHSVHAAKILNPIFADIPSIRAAYVQEMQWLAEQRNPFLCRVTDVLDASWGVGMIVDWMEGYSLQQHVQRYAGVEPLFAIKWISQILSGLHVLHSQDRFHLEIADNKIFLERVQGGFIAILMDFGLARRLSSEKQRPSFPLNSIRYLSPEQISAPHQVGAWSDVYAVGVLLYELLSGHKVFEHSTEFAIMQAISQGRLKPLSDLNPDISKDLCAIVQKATNLNAVDRYQNALQMLQDLQHLFSKEISHGFVPIPNIEKENLAEIVIENGEFVLIPPENQPLPQHLEPVPIDDWEEESAEKTIVKRHFWSLISMRFLGKYRWHLLLLAILITAIFTMYKGGVFTGREGRLEIINAPSWGTVLIRLDGQAAMNRKVVEQTLDLGEHLVDIEGGIFANSQCGRCCWQDNQSFWVPFSWKDWSSVVDLKGRNQSLSCPTAQNDFDFAYIEAQSSEVGAHFSTEMRADDAILHNVVLTQGFWLSKYEVTQQLFEQVMGQNPSAFQGALNPVDSVTWKDAILFCNRLSDLEGLDTCYQMQGDQVLWESGVQCKGYRLPTEAEWEIAARAGYPLVVDGKNKWFAGGGNVNLVAWGRHNSQQSTHEVGGKYPNAWGLYDMSGNVSEWVWDWYGVYSMEPINPKGVVSSYNKVLRGGSYLSSTLQLRVFDRDFATPSFTSNTIGFRIVRGM